MRSEKKKLIQSQLNDTVEVMCLTVPRRPYYEWEFVQLLSFSELYTTYAKHKRLRVFVEKGLECSHPECSSRATYLVKTMDFSGAIHVDVVDKDFKLMNVDHIKPVSAGGGEEMENKQPMCEYHNSLKSNKLVPY